MEKKTQYQKACALLEQLKVDTVFSSSDLYQLYLKNYGEINRKSISWIIYRLKKEKKISHIGRNRYIQSTQNNIVYFNYDFSKKTEKILKLISDDLECQIWETSILNRYLNHQLTTNIIFVEVEKGFEEYLFDIIWSKENQIVLTNPDTKIFNQLISDNMIVIMNLISETVSNTYDKRKISVEKLIVDLYANPYLKFFIDTSEYQDIIDTLMERYVVNKSTLNRYAKRRNKALVVEQYINDN